MRLLRFHNQWDSGEDQGMFKETIHSSRLSFPFRYSPPGAGFDGPYGGPMMGGGGPLPYSPYNRFTSMGSSPYGL